MLETATNEKAYFMLNQSQKQVFVEVYRNHPLAEYIDWTAFYDSTNGNTLDFVRCIDRYINEEGKEVFLLKKFTKDEMDYKLLFICEDNMFIEVPDTTD